MEQVYRARQPKSSPLWQCLSRHFDAFLEGYEERYQSRYGFLRPMGMLGFGWWNKNGAHRRRRHEYIEVKTYEHETGTL